MAEAAREDEDEFADSDPRTLKVLRANAKRRFTRLIKMVRDLMADHGSRSSIKNRRDDLIAAYQECDDANNRYIVVCPADETSAPWINAIEIDLDFWVNTVEEHLLSRADETSSNISSLHSQLVPLVAYSPHQRRPSSQPDWNDLRLRVNQLELQGVHGYAGSPSLYLGRSPPSPPLRPSSAPITESHGGAR